MMNEFFLNFSLKNFKNLKFYYYLSAKDFDFIQNLPYLSIFKGISKFLEINLKNTRNLRKILNNLNKLNLPNDEESIYDIENLNEKINEKLSLESQIDYIFYLDDLFKDGFIDENEYFLGKCKIYESQFFSKNL